jgi:cyclic pyranopterin phosphate synthase
MPLNGVEQFCHSDILSYEEILRIAKTAARIGFKKVRLTGGEPLVRRNVSQLVQKLAGISEITDLAMTTNGVSLNKMALDLFDAGLKRINVSMDTLNPLKFYKLTRCNKFDAVWEGITKAESVGFTPIKINVVIMRGVNDDELCNFARLTLEKPYTIRFIEFMPIGRDNNWRPGLFMPVSEMKSKIEEIDRLEQVPQSLLDGPALRYRLPSARGEIGFIGFVSRHFCHSCNRLRLTPDGMLRPCLMSDDELNVKTLLRRGCSREDLEALLIKAIALKPQQSPVPLHKDVPGKRMMSRIGG